MAYTTIKKPSDYFNTKLYTGTGSSQSITGVGFSPEMSWFKQRNTTRGHILEDIVRGAGNTLFPHDTSAEQTGGAYLTSFDSDGFTLPSSNVGTNESGGTYASWNWLANGAGVANTDGSISSTVSANTTSGFSIVSYTGNATSGATVGHGLGVAPSVVICKNRDATGNSWGVYHKSMGSTDLVFLDALDAAASYSTIYNNTAPSSSVVTLGNGGNANGNSQNIILYCFSEVKGFSKFGSYTGNGSTDGTFVYTGFKPAFVILKRIDTAGTDWNLVDNKRAGFNPDNYFLAPNSTGTENSVNDIIDLVSNGFKLTSASGASNTSGGTYIYMAFAEEPLVGDNPATAR